MFLAIDIKSHDYSNLKVTTWAYLYLRLMFVDLTIKTACNIKNSLFVPIYSNFKQNVASSSQDQIMEPSLKV